MAINVNTYTKHDWVDNSSPDLEAEILNEIETGIGDNNDAIKAIAAAVVSQIVNDPDKIASMAALYAVNQALGSLSTTVTNINSNLSNKANTSDIIDKVRLTGTVTTTTDANSPLGYSGSADMTALSGYPTGKEIIARVPMIAYSSTTTALIYFPTSTGVAVTAKTAATYTYIVDVLYKRG